MNNNPLDRIQEHYESLTKTDREIAAYILNNPRDTARDNISAIAKASHTSKSALVRFSNRIGYSGFAEFKFDLSRFLVSRNAAADDSEEQKDPIAAITDTYSRYILKIKDSLTSEDVRRIAKKISVASRVKILGFNRTFNSAMQLRQRLSKIGLDAEAISDTAIMTDLTDMLKESDTVVLFTISDNKKNYSSLVRDFHSHHCPVICFTMNPSLSFRKLCDEYVVLPRISADSSISFLDDQAIYMVFIEILLDAIAEAVRSD